MAIERRKPRDRAANYGKLPDTVDRVEYLREALRRLTGERGVDVVYDPVGSDLAEPALRSMAWGGRYLVIGFAGVAVLMGPGALSGVGENTLAQGACVLAAVSYAFAGVYDASPGLAPK